MRVLILNGSPKKVSDTMQLTNAFLEGLNEVGDNEVEIIHVIEKKIKPCLGCFGCWRKGDGKCVMQDDQNEILEKYQQADLIIWSFPLYCFGIPSHLKAVLDRMIPLVRMKMEERDGVVYHTQLADFERMKHVVICGAGFPQSDRNFEGVSVTCDKCFSNCTKIFVPETPLMNVPEWKDLADRKRGFFREAGREYYRKGRLALETMEKLEELMIPNEEYLEIVNRQ